MSSTPESPPPAMPPDPFPDDPFAPGPPLAAAGSARCGPAPGIPLVTVADGTVVVTSLSTQDPEVVAAARRWATDHGAGSLDRWARGLLSLGARAAAAAAGAADLEGLALRVESLARDMAQAADASASRVQAAVERAADPAVGTVAVAVDTALSRLAGGSRSHNEQWHSQLKDRNASALDDDAFELTGIARVALICALAVAATNVHQAQAHDEDTARNGGLPPHEPRYEQARQRARILAALADRRKGKNTARPDHPDDTDQ